VEHHSNTEPNQPSLKTDLITCFLKHNLLALELFISVIKFRNLLNDPEGLTVKLLFEVSVQQVLHVELITHNREGKDIA